ncbi:ZIP zinc transporter-domain-containing protein [Aspergillus coremiiformis]|uniref:ZIP zinc transporter-domain-containing protein n=1 Tax=Aspergillus coremiiformis TaxID=138285 RepID=A0A5N6ZAC3_9EURO|nr:ZIP zinc transporter-domain-containing protein [Aspergillus coremiiformis]
MNCPSRTDDTLLHVEWNQNPPFLAPDLTTRQDLNGVTNARENREKGSGSGHGQSVAYPDELGKMPAPRMDSEKNSVCHNGASLTLESGHPPIDPVTSVNAGLRSGHGQNCGQSLRQTCQSWAFWLLSVLFTSALISYESIGRYLRGSEAPPASATVVEPARDIALEKRSTCADGGVDGSDYNLPLHVGGLFIILSVSTLACAFPVLAVWFPRLRIPSSGLFFVSHFGTGVLIATAFVHLLPTAFQSLNDPCLSKFWTKDYPQMPGAIALAGVFLVTTIEMVFSPARHCCRGGTRGLDSPAYVSGGGEEVASMEEVRVTDSTTVGNEKDRPAGLEPLPHLRDLGPLIGRSSSISRAITQMGEDPERICRISSAPEAAQGRQETRMKSLSGDVERINDNISLSPEQKHRKEVMQVILLEMGILFHSVFIGMSLSVSVGSEFVILLIAIVFHQTFEGLALGSRIAALDWPEKAAQPWLMSLAYGCTTPIGQAIGLATHTLYSPNSEVGLLLVGTMNAISAGLLIFASLVELMSEDFLSDESWRVLRGKRRIYACSILFLGAFCMSLVGAWA